MTTAELQVQLNWIKELQEGLKGGFEKAYTHSLEQYVVEIDKIVSYMPEAIKKALSSLHIKYGSVDFRIPRNYENTAKQLREDWYSALKQTKEGDIKEYKELCYVMSELNQEGMQDLANIIRYLNEGSKKAILPREEVVQIKLTNLFNYWRGYKKINQEYWRDKPITKLIIYSSKHYVNVLNSLSSEVFLDKESSQYFVHLNFFNLPRSLDNFLKRVVGYIPLKKRVNYLVLDILNRNYERYQENSTYYRIAEFLYWMSFLNPFFIFPHNILKGIEYKSQTYLDEFKKTLIGGFLVFYLINALIGDALLYYKGRKELAIKQVPYSHSKCIKQVDYVIEKSTWNPWKGIYVGIYGAIPSLLIVPKHHPTVFNDEKNPISDLTIHLKHEGDYAVLLTGGGAKIIDSDECGPFSLKQITLKPNNVVTFEDLRRDRKKAVEKLINGAMLSVPVSNKVMKKIVDELEEGPNSKIYEENC